MQWSVFVCRVSKSCALRHHNDRFVYELDWIGGSSRRQSSGKEVLRMRLRGLGEGRNGGHWHWSTINRTRNLSSHLSSTEREVERACFQDWIRELEGREGCEGSVLNSVFDLLSLSSEGPHVCRWREIGTGDTGSGVIAHDVAILFQFLQQKDLATLFRYTRCHSP